MPEIRAANQPVTQITVVEPEPGKLDEAFKNYDKALSVRERFPQAREYLGEAHVQAALEQARLLQSYGADGEKDLAGLVAAFARAAVDLGITDPKQQAASHEGW